MTHPVDLEALGRHVADQEEGLLPSSAEHDRLRAAVMDRAFAPAPSRTPSRRLAAGLAAAAVVLGAASFLSLRRAPAPLSFFVGPREEPGAIGSWMSAPEASPFPVRFSDGTRASLLPAGRARVVAVSPFGADVVVESGAASFDVVHGSRSEWHVNAGPFVVHVTGTRFGVQWHADRDAFVLELYEGQVSISGCNLNDPYPIRAGERVEASCGRHEFRVAPIDSPSAIGSVASKAASATPPVTVNAEATPSAESGRHGSVTLSAASVNARQSASESHSVPQNKLPSTTDFEDRWIDLARHGLYADAFAAAEERGFDGERERRSAPEVLLLGDAARFSGHQDKARLAYQSVRQRFPGTTSAALAAFQLGRDDFDRRGDYAGAERWLRVYGEEAPNGALAPAAMGRLMEAEVRQGNRAEAERLAASYLERYPKGPHADAAHRVLGAAAGDAHR